MTQKIKAVCVPRLLRALLWCAAVLALPASAAGVTLDFNDLDHTFLGVGDRFTYQGLTLTTTSTASEASNGDLAGGIFDGFNPGMCMGLSCPVNNGSHGYYAALNDGALAMSAGASSTVQLSSFDASFIGQLQPAGAPPGYPLVAGLLEVRGYAADGSYMSERLELAGPHPALQEYYMARYEMSAGFASQRFANVSFFALSCNLAGECGTSKDNSGQFAIDNLSLSISPVPEPAAWLSLLAGLGCLHFLRRRRAI